MTTSTGWVHHYISTACEHGLCDERCRSTCKFCDAPCQHSCHPQSGDRELPPPWVDQARDIAQDLLLAAGGVKGLDRAGLGGLAHRVRSDPHLFWLRGEAQPPGVWTPQTTDDQG